MVRPRNADFPQEFALVSLFAPLAKGATGDLLLIFLESQEQIPLNPPCQRGQGKTHRVPGQALELIPGTPPTDGVE